MEKRYLKDDQSIKNDIEQLYNTAFPEDERPPFFWTYSVYMKTKESYIIGYYENNEFIGFLQYVIYQDVLYFAYLAIVENKRNRGYGRTILKSIREQYPDKTLLLCFEEVDPKYPDNDMRTRRMNLYKSLGYVDNGLKTQEGDVVYQSAYNGVRRVNYQEYQKIFDLVYGEGAHKQYLKCN